MVTLALSPRSSQPAPAVPSVISSFNTVARVAFAPDSEHRSVVRAIAAEFRRVVGVSRCAVFLPHEASGLFKPAVWVGRMDETHRIKAMSNGDDPYTMEILQRREPVVITDSLKDPRVAHGLKQSMALGVRSMVGLPLMANDQVVAMAFLDEEDRQVRFSDSQVEAAFQFGALSGTVLHSVAALSQRQAEVDKLSEENRALWYVGSLTEQIDAVFGGSSESVEGLATDVAKAWGHPVEVFDSMWRRRAVGLPAGLQNRRLADISDSRVRRHPKLAPAFNGAAQGRAETVMPNPALGLDLRCIVAPVRLGSAIWGFVVVHEAGGPFRRGDSRVALRVGDRLGARFSAQSHGARTLDDIRACFLRDVLLGEVEPHEVTGRADAAGVCANGDRVVAMVTGLADAGDSVRHEIADVLRARFGTDALVGVHGREVVAVLPCALGTRELSDDDVRARIDKAMADGGAPVGARTLISSRLMTMARAGDGQLEVRQMARCVHNFGARHVPRVVSASEFGAGLAAVSSADVDEMVRFGQGLLGHLRDHDDTGALMLTLRVFLDSMNVRRAATTLNVHENTVRHRLGTMEKVAGLRLLTNAQDQVRADLALLVFRLAGECDWSPEAS